MSRYAKVYYDASNPGSFGGLDRLWKEAGGSREEAAEWLKSQDTYTLHRPARKKFQSLVTWEGYPETFRTWIETKTLPQYA